LKRGCRNLSANLASGKKRYNKMAQVLMQKRLEDEAKQFQSMQKGA
jgi:hypothetical protein